MLYGPTADPEPENYIVIVDKVASLLLFTIIPFFGSRVLLSLHIFDILLPFIWLIYIIVCDPRF